MTPHEFANNRHERSLTSTDENRGELQLSILDRTYAKLSFEAPFVGAHSGALLLYVVFLRKSYFSKEVR